MNHKKTLSKKYPGPGNRVDNLFIDVSPLRASSGVQ